MIIKSVTPKGDAVPMSAREAIKPAIVAALKTINTQEMIFWSDMEGLKVSSDHSTVDKDGKWEAWAEGEIMVGKTRTVDDTFFGAKPHSFKMHYKLDKNEIGIPDVKIVDMTITPMNMDPTANIGDLDSHAAEAPAVEVEEKPARKK